MNCLPTLSDGPGGIPGDGPGPGSWGYQSCTETLHQFSGRGLRNFSFDLTECGVEPCASLFNGSVTPDTQALTRRYGGYAIGDGAAGVTNLIWSNGKRDPWSGGGFLTPVEGSGNYWFLMDEGAHHLDLRGPHDDDPPQVSQVRAHEQAIIWDWIEAASRA